MAPTIFAHLQITCKIERVGNDVVRPRCEVHVANRPSGNYKTCQHLREVVRRDSIPVARVQDDALKDYVNLGRNAGCVATGEYSRKVQKRFRGEATPRRPKGAV